MSRVATSPTSAEVAKERLLGQIGAARQLDAPFAVGALGTQVTELQIMDATVSHTLVAAPEPSPTQRAAQKVSHIGHALLRPFHTLRHAFLGAALVILEAVPPTLAPVRFTARNLPTLLLAALILGAPAAGTAFLWSEIPGWREGFPLNPLFSLQGLLSLGFLVSLYLALGFVAVIIGVIVRGMGKGMAGSTRALASRGQTAFEGDDDLAI